MTDKERGEIFKAHLTALFFQFKDKPHLLVEYMFQHDAIKDIFKDRIVENTKLKSLYEAMSQADIEKPFFRNLEDMQKYFNSLFEKPEKTKIHPVLGASTQEEALKTQLQTAIDNEDYEKAAKIRDYMKELKML